MPNPNDRQEEIARVLVETQGKQLALASMCFFDAGQKTVLCMSSAMVGVAAICCNLTEAGHRDGPNYAPTSDDVLFACTFLAESVEFVGGGALNIEFAFNNLIRTLEVFQTRTGRSYEPAMDKSLLKLVQEIREKANEAFPGDLSQFRPQ
jgi:hypothetical protein